MLQEVVMTTTSAPLEPMHSGTLTVVWVAVAAAILFGSMWVQEIRKDDWSVARALAVASSGAAVAWILTLLVHHFSLTVGGGLIMLTVVSPVVVGTIVAMQLYGIRLLHALINVAGVFALSLVATVFFVMPAISLITHRSR